MQRVLLVCGAVLAAAVAVVPVASARDYTVRAGGLVMDNPHGGTVQTLGEFHINLKAGPGHKVTYLNRTTGVSFHSVLLQQLLFTGSSVKITGVGMVNGKRVHFTAVATDHPTKTDAFKISWNHQASHGGNVLEGNVKLLQI